MGEDAGGGESNGGGHSAFPGDASPWVVAVTSHGEHVPALPPPAAMVRGELIPVLPPSASTLADGLAAPYSCPALIEVVQQVHSF
jgi:hypothetical protein